MRTLCKYCPQSAFCAVWDSCPVFDDTYPFPERIEPRYDGEIAFICYPPVGGGGEYYGSLKVFRIKKKESEERYDD